MTSNQQQQQQQQQEEEEITTIKPTSNHTATMILLHGMLEVTSAWEDPLKEILKHSPHVKVIMPQAPVIPLTINNKAPGTAWFDVEAFKPGMKEDTERIVARHKMMENIIQKEIDSGIPPERIMLAGFSMGAAVVLYTMVSMKVKLAGCLTIGGFFPVVSLFGYQKKECISIPIRMLHGDADTVVVPKLGNVLNVVLKQKFGFGVAEFILVPGLGHQYVHPMVYEQFSDFLVKYLPSI
ncbi:hypothetical protein DFA_00357 [Cavenderia fasciculata]|uniref:Phospholipase/carboxylesterase/thioesterase domain-containing protein n=1 Tax=Cavenderia fasciculata TaxID=261658 RepID=F4PRE4_CACFS|nr:uncharacterized protein DFA_00357 [Cavenderia fasciculata]EGG20496.1 hypothetical protein DFA_00357 [Cavenderia fasciculata]|eukprot:XP_004358346.1 hypothetical protein DFA_00357 [Cavenderia fasciculata]